MYTISDYGAMIADTVRTKAFVRALRNAITPDSVVVDIGTGTGIFALLACRLGAKRVYAIEPDDAIEVAKAMAAANGCSNRIEFTQDLSTTVSLPERADIIVSDIGGMLPWFRSHIASIVDARRRFLAPGGVLIPRQDTAWAAVVDASDWYAQQTASCDHGALEIDMKAAWQIVSNTFSRMSVRQDQILSEVKRWVTVDYATVEERNVRGCIEWTATRAAVSHGFALGFDRLLSNGVHLSNAPDAPADIRTDRTYGTALFPWSSPVSLAAGDHVVVELDATVQGEDYVWNWKTSVFEGSRTGAVKASFSQSTFFGVPLSAARLRKRGEGYTPLLTEDGRIAHFVLDSMSQRMPVGEIAKRLAAEFAGRFQHPRETLSYVADLAQKYG
jgi:protein arginine N-methyltransferase 1